jgi:hypothetical protein
MNESALRWQARIGSLKPLSIIALILVVLLLIALVGEFLTAIQNPKEPQLVTVEQLVSGSVEDNRYITLEGYAIYDAGYEMLEDNTVVATYYLLLDDQTGHLIIVKASSANVDARQSDWITLVGMTQDTPVEMRDLIHEDLDYYQGEGFLTTPDLLVVEGKAPKGTSSLLVQLLLSGAIGVIAVVPFFFPSTIFAPRPVELATAAPQEKQKKSAVKASGRFLQLKKVEPSIELGKRRQRFTNTVANLIPLQGDRLMVYIRHVVRYNFIPVSKTHWGVFLTAKNAIEVEPGVHYGWKDRPAVRFRYYEQEGKEGTLLLSFDDAADQASFIKLLKERGFGVGTGISSQVYR